MPSEQEITRDGYTFGGWYDNEELNGDKVTDIGESETGDKEYWAKWILNGDNYSVTTEDGNDYNQNWTNQTVTITPKDPALRVSVSTDDGENWGEWQESISYATDIKESVRIRVSDTADGTGNVAEASESIAIKVDKTQPVISQKFSAEGDNDDDTTAFVFENEVYRTRTAATIQIKIEEAHLDTNWADNVKIELVDDSNNNVVKTIYGNTLSWTKSDDASYVYVDVTFGSELTDQGIYHVEVSGVKDSAGNKQADFEPVVFKYDVIPPYVSVERANGCYHEDGKDEYYYNSDITFTMQIIDEDLVLNEDGVPQNTSYSVKKDGVVLGSYELPAFTAVADKKNTYTATVKIPTTEGEGEYEVSLEVSDRLQTSSDVSAHNVMDLTAPITKFSTTELSGAQTQTLTVTFEDGTIGETTLVGSGVKATYYYVVADEGYDASKLTVNGQLAATTATEYTGDLVFATNEEFRGTVYFYAEDNAGNSGEGLDSPYQVSCKINIDGKAPRVTITDPTESAISGIIETDGTRYSYVKGVFTIRVEDDNISDPNTNSNMAVSVSRSGETVTAGENTYSISEWSREESGAWQATVTVYAPSDRSNDGGYVVSVTAVDDCDNKTKTSVESNMLVIDTDAPSVTIERTSDLTGETVDGVEYTSKDVTYELTIEDANLRLTTGGQPLEDEDVLDVYLTTDDGEPMKINTDTTRSGDAYTLSEWKLDGNKWTATLTIKAANNTAKVEYVVELKATDKARTEESSVTSAPLVIDTTKPVVQISDPEGYTNSQTVNGVKTYYSSEDVTYTLTVSDPDIVELNAKGSGSGDVVVTVQVDGKKVTPGENEETAYELSEWTSDTEKETWTATLKFNANAGIDHEEHYITLSAVDRAANSTGDVPENPNQDEGATSETQTKRSWPLVMDTVAPVITIGKTPENYTGIQEDNVYYTSGNASVTITVTDDTLVYEKGAFTLGGVDVKVLDANSSDVTGTDVTGTYDDYNVATSWDAVEGGYQCTITFNAADTENTHLKVEVTAYDGTVTKYDAGNKTNCSSATSAWELVVDTDAPSVEIERTSKLTGETVDGVEYTSEDVTYTLSVSDTNLALAGDTAPKATIQINGEGVEPNTEKVEPNTGKTVYTVGSWKEVNGEWTLELTIRANGRTVDAEEYKITLDAEDKAGNTTTDENQVAKDCGTASSTSLVIDTVSPTVEYVYSGDFTVNDNNCYYYLAAENLAAETSGSITVNITDETIKVAKKDFTLGSAYLAIYYAAFDGDGTYTKLTDPSSYGLSWGDWSTGVNGVTSRTLTFGEDATEGKYYIVTTPTDQAKNGGEDWASNCGGYYAVVDHTAPTVTFTNVKGYTNYNENTGYYYFNENAEISLKIEDNDSTLTYAAPEDGTYKVGNVVVEVSYQSDLTNGSQIEEAFDYDPSWTQDGSFEWSNRITFHPELSEAEGRYAVKITVTDGAGNETVVFSNNNKDSKDSFDTWFVLDSQAPVPSVDDYQQEVSKNTELQIPDIGSVPLHIASLAENQTLSTTFRVVDNYITLSNADTSLGKSEITVTRYNNLSDAVNGCDGERIELVDGEALKLGGWVNYDSKPTDWTQQITLSGVDQGYYILSADATDTAQNNSEIDAISDILVVDNEAPEISHVVNDTDGEDAAVKTVTANDGSTAYYLKQGYDSVSVTFTVSDNNDWSSDKNNFWGDLEFVVTRWDFADAKENGQVTLSYTESGWEKSNGSWKNTLTFTSEGIYSVQLNAKDIVENSSSDTVQYLVIDKTPPTGSISSSGSGFSGNQWEKFLDTITFGLFSKSGITTTLTWNDESDSFLNSGEGVESVQYWVYVVNSAADTTKPFETENEVNDAAEKAAGWNEISRVNADEFTFNTSNDTKFVVYLKMTDIAGNWSIISSDGLITENDPSQVNGDATNPEILVTVPNQNGGYSGIHDSSVTLGVQVIEYPSLTFSGINEVSYTVADGHGGTVNMSRGGMSYSNIIDANSGRGDETVLISVPSGYESDQIYFTAEAVDNAGNEKTVTYSALNVDNHTPEATITYNNNTVYNGKYFNQPRTATVVVTEMNFDSKNTSVTTAGSVSGWSASGSGSGTTNTATVSYTADGDYTLAFQTTDKAGHTLTDSGVAYSGVATKEFTLDMTKPTATITFRDAGGNTVPSGGYANSTVTATITVVEHNFDESSATNGITITRDGEPYRTNITWLHNGDTHTATVSFTEEEGAYYTFNMSFVDLANNRCDEFRQVSFYVDTTAPSVIVSNIANRSANNARTVAPVITITDKYYDPNQVTITLRGAKKGVISNPYSVTDIQDGQQFTFANITDDDIYTITLTVTDLAGNVIRTMYVEMSDETTEELMFSVNREGSTYGVDENTQKLLDGYYTNGLTGDLVITVINVDEIEGFVITTSRGLIDSKDLVEGEDYTIEKEEITGGYLYTITIFKEVFEKDGAYAISIYTEDKAGNTSTNVTADEKHGLELEFYLDTEAPSIVLNNLDKGGTYAVESYDGGSISVSDQTLDEISVVITYRDGTTATYVWESDEINTPDFNGTYIARLDGAKAIAQSNSRINIRVTARDKAGNVMEGPYTETDEGVVLDEDYNFYVTTNALTRFYANKGLFYGTIGILVILVAVGTGIALSRRKKQEEETV